MVYPIEELYFGSVVVVVFFLVVILSVSFCWPSSTSCSALTLALFSLFYFILVYLFFLPTVNKGKMLLCVRKGRERTGQNLIDIHSHVRWVAADVAGSRPSRDMTVALDRVPHKQFGSIPLCLCLAWRNSLEERRMERREAKDRWVDAQRKMKRWKTNERKKERRAKKVCLSLLWILASIFGESLD